MTGLEAAAWGVFGGFAVEGLEFTRAIRRVGGWPWSRPQEPGPLPLATSVFIRLLVGAGLAAAAASAGQVQGPFGALAVGVAAPLLIEQLARHAPGAAGAATERAARTPAVRRASVIAVRNARRREQRRSALTAPARSGGRQDED